MWTNQTQLVKVGVDYNQQCLDSDSSVRIRNMGSLEKTKGCFQASVGSNQQFSLESGLVYLDPKKKLVLTGSVGSNQQFSLDPDLPVWIRSTEIRASVYIVNMVSKRSQCWLLLIVFRIWTGLSIYTLQAA